MPYKIKLEKFEGPLDLLLQLIEQDEMDITQVSLATVTEQYLVYINSAGDIRTEELADFLVVAAKLLLIKSRTLLPQLQLDDEEETTELEQQLKIYREFHEASKVLHKMVLKKHFLFARDRMVVKVDNIFNPPSSITADKLHMLFAGVLKEIEPWVNLPREVLVKTISIRERISNLQQLIKQEANLSFRELLKGSKNKTDVIITFLAILELVKQQSIAVVQKGVFDDIQVQRLAEYETDIIKDE